MTRDRNATPDTSASLHDRIKVASDDELLVIYRFFDGERLRQYYTGLLADIREELQQRGVDVIEAVRWGRPL